MAQLGQGYVSVQYYSHDVSVQCYSHDVSVQCYSHDFFNLVVLFPLKCAGFSSMKL